MPNWYAGTPAELLQAGLLTPEHVEQLRRAPGEKCSMRDEYGTRIVLRRMNGGRVRVIYTLSEDRVPARTVATAAGDTVRRLLERFAFSCR